jgi:hypothetical protein
MVRQKSIAEILDNSIDNRSSTSRLEFPRQAAAHCSWSAADQISLPNIRVHKGELKPAAILGIIDAEV